MEYLSIQKNISTSPRKLRLVADLVKNLSPEKAVEILAFTNKAAALPLSKAIKTAMANAKGANQVFFKSLEINEGTKLKRYRVGTAGRGRGRPYKKRMSHIKVVLTDEIPVGKLTLKNRNRKETRKKVELADLAIKAEPKVESLPEAVK